jgi:hypothetical protein
MKDYVTDKDRVDLDAAKAMVVNGKRLRANVLSRIRMRRYRDAAKDTPPPGLASERGLTKGIGAARG